VGADSVVYFKTYVFIKPQRDSTQFFLVELIDWYLGKPRPPRRHARRALVGPLFNVVWGSAAHDKGGRQAVFTPTLVDIPEEANEFLQTFLLLEEVC